jgi:hypothetical protein
MSDVLFQVTTEHGTLTRERSDGPAKVYSDVRFLWEADRDGEGPPVPYDEGLSEPDDGYNQAFLDSLFTLDEALAVIDWLDEHEPDGTHKMAPVQLPVQDGFAPRSAFPYNAREGVGEATVGDLALRGSFDLQDATFEGLKEDGKIWRDVTLTLPVELVDWIEGHPDPVGFLATMHEVSEALGGHSPGTFEPADELPF